MLILHETSTSLSLFKVVDDLANEDIDSVRSRVKNTDDTRHLIKLAAVEKFKNVEQATKVTKRLVEGKVSKKLKKLLKKYKDSNNFTLGVAEPKIGSALHELFNIDCVYTPVVQEFMRIIRENYEKLVPDSDPGATRNMSVGLAHKYDLSLISFSRYKIKFNPDKIDTMIVQSINLLDDIDKEINNYVMRCKEWYSWHFPELAKLVTDNHTYTRLVKLIQFKTSAESVDISEFVEQPIADEIKASALVSMGSDVTNEDMEKIVFLADHIIELTDYRSTLMEYLVNRMRIVAPNLSILVGEVVGARLIAHAGSLNNLSKQAASTIQVLGAEKALFNALKCKKNTPKYGLIYHAGLISQAPLKLKGKMSRTLAAKCSLAIRCDALSDHANHTQRTLKDRAKLENRLSMMEQSCNKQLGKGEKNLQTRTQRYPTSNDALLYNPAVDTFLPKKRSFQTDSTFSSDEEKRHKKE